MSPSAYLRGAGNAIFYTQSWLDWLERAGTRVVNGRAAYGVETSKVAERLLALEAAGLDLVLLQFSPQLKEMERFAEEVIPLVNGTSRKTVAA